MSSGIQYNSAFGCNKNSMGPNLNTIDTLNMHNRTNIRNLAHEAQIN